MCNALPKDNIDSYFFCFSVPCFAYTSFDRYIVKVNLSTGRVVFHEIVMNFDLFKSNLHAYYLIQLIKLSISENV